MKPYRSFRRLGFLAAVATAFAAGDAQAVDVLTPDVVAQYAHDTDAFTQGLLFHEGFLYESTGIWGQSTLRRVDLESGEVLQMHALPDEDFGEGLARVGDTLWQLTWQNGIAYRYALDDFELLGTAEYTGEGWGLCFDGERLVMSDGSSTLSFRDPETFELLGTVDVTADDAPLDNLNELECIGESVYANIWYEDFVVEIDPSTGVVLTAIDAEGLLTDEEASSADVLNGIAFHPETGHLYLTGKDWPWIFELEVDGLDIEEEEGTSTGGDETGAAESTGEPELDETSTGGDESSTSTGEPELPGSTSGEEPEVSSSSGGGADQTDSGSGGCAVGGGEEPAGAVALGLLAMLGIRRRRR